MSLPSCCIYDIGIVLVECTQHIQGNTDEVDDSLFLKEVLFMEIRCVTIFYCSLRNKERNLKEKSLLKKKLIYHF